MPATHAAVEQRVSLWMSAYDPKETLAVPKEVKHWSLTTLREKPVNIGAKVVRHGRYITSQVAEVAISRTLIAEILRRIDSLRPAPSPPWRAVIPGESHLNCWTSAFDQTDKPLAEIKRFTRTPQQSKQRTVDFSDASHGHMVTPRFSKFKCDSPAVIPKHLDGPAAQLYVARPNYALTAGKFAAPGTSSPNQLHKLRRPLCKLSVIVGLARDRPRDTILDTR